MSAYRKRPAETSKTRSLNFLDILPDATKELIRQKESTEQHRIIKLGFVSEGSGLQFVNFDFVTDGPGEGKGYSLSLELCVLKRLSLGKLYDLASNMYIKHIRQKFKFWKHVR